LIFPCFENCPGMRRGRARFLRAIRLGPEGQNAGFLQGKTHAREKKAKPCGKGFIPADITGGMQAIRGYCCGGRVHGHPAPQWDKVKKRASKRLRLLRAAIV
jgi:hypothetical protein